MLGKWLGNRDFWKPTLKLALPIAFQNLLMSSFGMVDTIMIGQLGEVALASVGMAGQWSWLMNIFLFGFCSGSSVFISQYWGVKDMRGIHRTYGMVLANVMAVAAVFTLVGVLAPQFVLGLFTADPVVIAEGVRYLRPASISFLAIAINQGASTVLRSTENVKLPMYTSMVSVAANAALNYIFIFGAFGLPAMGVVGAAVATAISAWINPLLLYGISFAQKNLLISPIRELFTFSRDFAKKFYRVSLPVILNESLWALGTLGYNMVYGRMGTNNYSALTIFRTVENIAFVFFVGLCHASTVLVGKNIGAGNFKQAITDARRFAIVVPLLSLAVGLCMIALRAPVLTLFNVSEEVRQTAMAIMVIYGLELCIRNIPYINIVGIFRAGGDTKTGLLYDILCVWCIALPVTIVCGLVFQLPFLLVYTLMLLCEDLPKITLCIRRFHSRKWIQPVTAQGAETLSAGEALE